MSISFISHLKINPPLVERKPGRLITQADRRSESARVTVLLAAQQARCNAPWNAIWQHKEEVKGTPSAPQVSNACEVRDPHSACCY